MAIVYLILALLIAVIAVIFAWQNAAFVTVSLFTWKVEEAPLSLVIIATLLIGILIGWLFAAPSLIKHSFRASNQRKRIGALEKELEGHKGKPVETSKPEAVKPSASSPEAKPSTPIPASKISDTDPLSHS